MNPEFAKYVKVYKMKVPLVAIRNQMRAGGKFNPDDILLFASGADIHQLKACGDYKGSEF